MPRRGPSGKLNFRALSFRLAFVSVPAVFLVAACASESVTQSGGPSPVVGDPTASSSSPVSTPPASASVGKPGPEAAEFGPQSVKIISREKADPVVLALSALPRLLFRLGRNPNL